MAAMSLKHVEAAAGSEFPRHDYHRRLRLHNLQCKDNFYRFQ